MIDYFALETQSYVACLEAAKERVTEVVGKEYLIGKKSRSHTLIMNARSDRKNSLFRQRTSFLDSVSRKMLFSLCSIWCVWYSKWSILRRSLVFLLSTFILILFYTKFDSMSKIQNLCLMVCEKSQTALVF